MRSLKLSLLSLSLVAGLSSTAAAQQVNFDDLPGYLAMISSPYAGFTWNNAFVMNPGVVYGLPNAGGFATALSSGERVMGNAGGQAMSISGSTFNLLGGTFAAGWTNGLNLNVKGYSAGNLMYDQNYSLNWSVASNLGLNMFGVDNVVFSSSGGTVDGVFGAGPNQSFAADNLEFSQGKAHFFLEGGDVGIAVVPEPMTVSLMAAGLLVLGGAQARRRRASQAR